MSQILINLHKGFFACISKADTFCSVSLILNTFTRKQLFIKDVNTMKRKMTQCKRQAKIKMIMKESQQKF